jgi:3-oxoacyl-[acyl-carrier protein] reductase
MIETGLKGKVVIVTGAAAGIGRATALGFAAEGCRVALWDRNAERLDQVAREIRKSVRESGGEAHAATVDVASGEDVNAAVAAVMAKWSRIDVLINNAGILRDGQLVKYKDGELIGTMSDEAFDQVIQVNLRGVFLCTRAVAPHMIQAGGGVILNASSVVGLYGNFGQTNYVAAKTGVIGMTRTWARELGRYKIRVNAVTPGYIATEMIRNMPQKILDSLKDHTPLGRMGEARDIANAYVWLASDAASFVHGAVIPVDGGAVVGT